MGWIQTSEEKALDIYICDNNPVHMEYTDRFVTSYFAGKPEVPYLCSKLLPEELDERLSRKRFHGDLILLDIRMQWKDGIALAEQINRAAPRCQIIFLTGYIDYATMVYETHHLYFVLKTQMDQMLPRAMDKALAFLQAEVPGLSVSPQLKIPFSRILYLEKDQHDTQVRTEVRDFKVPKSLRELALLLDKRFLRCHGSYIVNLQRVSHHSSTQFVLDTGVVVPIGRTFQHAARNAYLDYLSSLL